MVTEQFRREAASRIGIWGVKVFRSSGELKDPTRHTEGDVGFRPLQAPDIHRYFTLFDISTREQADNQRKARVFDIGVETSIVHNVLAISSLDWLIHERHFEFTVHKKPNGTWTARAVDHFATKRPQSNVVLGERSWKDFITEFKRGAEGQWPLPKNPAEQPKNKLDL